MTGLAPADGDQGQTPVGRPHQLYQLTKDEKKLEALRQLFAMAVRFDVFLCHSSADKPIVEQIARDLRIVGITYWLDGDQIKFGDQVIAKIEEGLQNSRYIVPCVSANVSVSGWVRAEYGAVLNAELSGVSERVVIPLILDDCNERDIPPLLRDKKRVNYSNKIEMAEFVQFLRMMSL